MSVERDEETAVAREYYQKFPANLEQKRVVILDPMLATGNFGAGRILVYTSDPAPHWGCNFVQWDRYNAFWVAALEHLLHLPRSLPPYRLLSA